MLALVLIRKAQLDVVKEKKNTTEEILALDVA